MKRVKSPALPVPQNSSEFERAAVELAAAMREIDRINATAADRLAIVKLDAKNATEALVRHCDALWRALGAYAEAHRDELVPEGRKSAAIAAGVIGWRMSKAKIVLTDEADDIADWMIEHDHEQFLRVSTELDKQALLAAPETAAKIPGITIVQAEELFFRPLDLDDERVKKAPASKAA